MVFLLIALVISMVFVYFGISNRDFLSPSLVLFAIFVLCTFFGLLGNEGWKVEINTATVFVILSGLYAFAAGEVTVDLILNNGKVSRKFFNVIPNKIYKIPKLLVFSFLIYGLIVFYLYFKQMVNIARNFGYSGGLSFMALSYAKKGLIAGADLGSLLSAAINLVYGIGINCIFVFCFNTNICHKKFKNEFYLLLPCVPHLLCYAVSGSRNGFITIISYSFFCFFLTYYKTHDMRNRKSIGAGKLLSIIVIILATFYGLFQLLGIALGKTGVRSPLEMLYIYAGSSIPALSKYISSGVKHTTTFGSETFVGILNLLNRVLGTPAGVKDFAHVRFANSSTTNIFTCFREYIDDFGIVGSIVLMYIGGFLHKLFFERIRKSRKVDFLVIVYSYFMYYLISSIFAASTTIYLFSTTQISQFIWIILIYFIFNKYYLKHKRISLRQQQIVNN